jgi:cellulose synthase operon protein B
MRSYPSPANLRHFRSFLIAAGLAGVVICPIARAQIVADSEENSATAMQGALAPRAVATPATPATAPASHVVRFPPSTLEGLRLSGEVGDLRWPIYLTTAQAKSALSFRLGYLSAASVLPDASVIEVKINDKQIGADTIAAASGLRTVTFNVPVGTLQPGYNAVSISLQQRHRVDCSVTATYELWTKIEPAETGLVMAGDVRGITDVADIPALLPRADGSLPIHILLSGRTNPPHLERLIRATQIIAIAGHFLQPDLDVGLPSEDIYGVDLALGTRVALARLPQLAGQLGTMGPLVAIVPATSSGRPKIIVTGSTDVEVDQAITNLGRAIEERGSAAGLEAIARYPALFTSGATSFRLRDLGIRSQEFDGRLFRRSVSLRLPADFLASDYGRGTLDLAGGYAAGLLRDSQVRVDVNGHNAGVIMLPYASGDVFKHNRLFLPLSFMRAGLNRIDIIAETPRREDADCGQVNERRFLLLDSSEVSLPVLARIVRLPDLGVTTAGSLPYLIGTAHLIVPKPDRDTMSAALSLTARLAVAAGRPIPFHFSTKMDTNGDDGSTLIVSPARQLDPSVMTAVGLDPAEVEAAWHGLVAATASSAPRGPASPLPSRWWLTSTDGPPACRLPTQSAAPFIMSSPDRALPEVAPVKDAGNLLEVWSGRAASASGWQDRIARASNDAVHWARRLVQDVHFPAGARPHPDGVTIDASLVLAQGTSPGSRDNVTTIITAPDAATLRASMACLFDPQVWSKVYGRLAIVNASNGDVTATPAASFHYVDSGPFSLMNWRLVIAGWFSLNPLAFAAAALVLALCLSGTTLWFVKNVGRRSE